jgi:hypothetical protein
MYNLIIMYCMYVVIALRDRLRKEEKKIISLEGGGEEYKEGLISSYNKP